MARLLVAAALLAAAHARSLPEQQMAGAADTEVTAIPGFTGPLPSKHYAGYINVNATTDKNLYYYFVTSEAGPEAPVVLWLNGGPGCSSMDGFIYEHGPFAFHETPGKLPVLTRNPYAWSTVAHMVYLDSPAGVGLSYSATASDYKTGDAQTAIDADAFLRGFFTRYPEYLSNELFIMGESYAGIYVPDLATAVVNGNDAGVTPQLNLAGYAVGNGCTDDEFDGNALVPYAVGKSLIPQDLAATAHAACGGGNFWNDTSAACNAALSKVDRIMAGLNIYASLEDCVTRSAAKTDAARALLPPLTVGRAWPLRATLPPVGQEVPTWASLAASVPCMDLSLAETWLNVAEVRAALHAKPAAEIGAFELCTNKIRYRRDAGSMLPLHRALLKRGVRALVYSGDHDGCVPHTGSEAWTSAMGFPVVDEWRSWLVDEGAPGLQVAGFTRRYEGGLTYATVKGAGHTVPEYKPAQALAMFARFLKDAPL